MKYKLNAGRNLKLNKRNLIILKLETANLNNNNRIKVRIIQTHFEFINRR